MKLKIFILIFLYIFSYILHGQYDHELDLLIFESKQIHFLLREDIDFNEFENKINQIHYYINLTLIANAVIGVTLTLTVVSNIIKKINQGD